MTRRPNKLMLLLWVALSSLLVLSAVFGCKQSPGFSEDDVRAYALDYIKSRPQWILKEEEADIKDVTIQKEPAR